ncbi:MAG: Lrp/AsnC family transcriptional regulator [Promethearchaeota archaeon]
MTDLRIDETDRRILRHLVRDARQSVAGLARRLGLSESAVRHRIDRLVEHKVIDRFTVSLDYNQLGYPITVFLGLNVGNQPGSEVAKALKGIDEIVDIFTITGEFDLFIRIICRDMSCFEAIVEKIRALPYVERTRSFVVINQIRSGFYDNIVQVSG